MIKVEINNVNIDLFPDTEVSGAYKPVSIEDGDTISNPYSYEFQIPLTIKNKLACSYNDDTKDFISEGLRARIINDDVVMIDGFAYISNITTNKLETVISVQIVDAVTYILKSVQEDYIGEIINYSSEFSNKRYAQYTDIDTVNNDLFTYVYARTTGFDEVLSENGGADFVYIGKNDNTGEVAIALRLRKAIDVLFSKYGITVDYSDVFDKIRDNKILVEIPIKTLVSPRKIEDSGNVVHNGLFMAVASSNLKNTVTNQDDRLLNNNTVLKDFGMSFVEPTLGSKQISFSNPNFFPGDSRTYGYGVQSTPVTYSMEMFRSNISYRFAIKPINVNYSGRLEAIRGYASSKSVKCSYGRVSLVANIGNKKIVISRGSIDENGNVSIESSLYNNLWIYTEAASVDAAHPYTIRFELMADSSVDITLDNGRVVKWSGSDFSEEGMTEYTSTIAFSCKNIISADGSHNFTYEIKSVGDLEGKAKDNIKASGVIYTEDRKYLRKGFYTLQEAMNDKYSMDFVETLNSSGITMASFIRDALKRFNISASVNGLVAKLTHRASDSSSIDYVSLNRDNLNSEINITKNTDENTIKDFMLKNQQGGSMYDKYYDGLTFGDSEPINVSPTGANDKSVSMSSSVIPYGLHGEYNIISDSVSEVLLSYKSAPRVGVTPYRCLKRESYGVRYGIEGETKGVLPLMPVIHLISDDILHEAVDYAFCSTRMGNVNMNLGNVEVKMQRVGSTDIQTVTVPARIERGVFVIDGIRHTLSGSMIRYTINKTSLINFNKCLFDGGLYWTIVRSGLDSMALSAKTENNVGSDSSTIWFNIPNYSGDTCNIAMPIYNPEESKQPSYPPVRLFKTGFNSNDGVVLLPRIEQYVTSVNNQYSLSFNNRGLTAGLNHFNAIDLFYKGIIDSIYTKNALYIEGEFFLTNTEIKQMLNGCYFIWEDNRYGLVEANDIDFTQRNGSIVKLKLYKL